MNEAAEIIGIYIHDTAGEDGNPGLTTQKEIYYTFSELFLDELTHW